MAAPILSRRKTDIITGCAFVASLIIYAYTAKWWPYIFLALGIPLVIRQILRGRRYDAILTSVIFGGLFLTFLINMRWNVLMPVLFVVGAITIFYREFAFLRPRVGKEQVEDMKNEIDDSSE